MRADRLLSLMLLLRSRGRMSATALAAELEVSVRTVLRDVEALSTAGIPVYAERGRAGGFALLPGTSDLTGLTPDEALALLTAGSRASAESLGLAPALASGLRKVLAALPDARRDSVTRAAERVVVRPGGFLRDPHPGPEPEGPLDAVRHAVFAGRRLRIRYTARDGATGWRTVDPVGLVGAAGRWYLLATREGADRTYRVSRIHEAVALDEPADRPAGVDLERLWERRRAEFAASLDRLRVTVRCRAERRDEVARAALEVLDERPDGPGRLRLEVTYDGLDHATEALWRAGEAAQALMPPELRTRLATRAAAVAAQYGR